MMEITSKPATMSSREVAVIVEKDHKNLLVDIRSYIKHMEKSKEESTEGNRLKIQPIDFFIESTYVDERNREQPSYEITRKGCEFIANKLTGQKGTIFTAMYINRFHELEDAQMQPPYNTTKAVSVGEVTNLIKVLSGSMRKQGIAERIVARQIKLLCDQFGIKTDKDFIRTFPFEQMSLDLNLEGGGVDG